MQYFPPLRSLVALAQRATEAVAELLLPGQCARCHVDLALPAEGVWLCDGCRALLDPPARPCCSRCGLGLAAEHLESSVGCPVCCGQTWRYERVIALGSYEGVLREAVLACKVATGEPLAMALAELLWRRRQSAWNKARFDVVVPVPMHWRRRWRRGVNSPERIAGHLAGRLGVAHAAWLLRRRKSTAPQAGLRYRERFRNLRSAFVVRAGYRLRGARVLLVDDVLTTGATCNSAALALRRAGARQVVVAVVARAHGAETLPPGASMSVASEGRGGTSANEEVRVD